MGIPEVNHMEYFQYMFEIGLIGFFLIVAVIKDFFSFVAKDKLQLTLKAIEGLEGATGGGHEDATGARINVDDLPLFKDRIEKLVG